MRQKGRPETFDWPRRIKEDDDLKKIPTVVLTTSASESDMISIGYDQRLEPRRGELPG